MLNLDTHILVYALEGTLKPAERKLLDQNAWSISAIVLWELAKLSQLKRVSIDLHSLDFTNAISRIHVWPIDLRLSQELLRLDFKSDPADEIIGATSILNNVPLLTRDKVLLKSKLIPLAK